ncbi:MAG: TlpA family protein disulfide reductase [Phycisphaerales bacterium]|nr:TlpA family protein disulfide reductase [Phycisphaerales bacterium]
MTRWTTALALTLLAGTPLVWAQSESLGGDQAEHGDRPTTAPVIGRPQPATDAQDARPRSPDAVAILQSAAEAIKDGFAATVKTHLDSESAMAGMFPTTEGRWVQKALGGDGQWAVRHVGYGTVSQGKEQVDFDLLWQPDRVSWLDHEAKTFYVQPLRRGNKPGSAHQLGNSPWDRAEPLADGFVSALATAAAIELGEPGEIDGRAVDVVKITSKLNADTVLWSFDHATHLPRRAEIVLPENPMLSGAMRVDFLDPTAGAEAAVASEFEMLPPETYTTNIAGVFQPREEGEMLDRAAGGVPPVRTNPNGGGAPEWEVADADGALVSPGSLRGRVSVLYFWGTWSAPSKKFTPDVKSLAEHYAGQPVEVITMAIRENDPALVGPAAEEQGQTWRRVPKADDAAAILNVRMAPTIVVLGKEGELLYKSGRPSADNTEQFTRIRAIIDSALTAEPSGEESKARPAAAEGQAVETDGATKVGRPAKVIRKKD